MTIKKDKDGFSKVMYCGFPMLMNFDTNEVKGFWSFVIEYLAISDPSEGEGFTFVAYNGLWVKAFYKWFFKR